ncbi:DNA polymerase I, partial [bacterium]
MSDRKRLYLMDGTQFAYRAYFAFIRNPLRNSKGINTSAPFGMLQSILKILESEKLDAFAVAFDKGKPVDRLEIYPEYKSSRAKMPDEMRDSLPYIRGIVEAMNIPIIEKTGVEADDLLGTIAKRAEKKGWDVVLVTGDKDFLQLVDEHISILAPSKGALPTEWFTVENAHRRFGVPPAMMVDFLALMGDNSDNVPGVKGIGKKTAASLINEFGGLKEIYEHLDEISGGTAKKLESDREMAELSQKLVTIDTDIDIDFDWENAPLTEPDYEKLIPILEELEFTSLLDRFYRESGKGKSGAAESEIEYVLVDTMGKFDELIEKLKSAARISLDTETTRKEPMLAELVGLSFAIEPGKAYYIPVGHRRPGEMFPDEDLNLPKKEVLTALKPVLEAENPAKVGQNLKYDYIVLHNEGLNLRGIDGDVMLADY